MLTTTFRCITLGLVLCLSIFVFEAESRPATLDEGAAAVQDDIHGKRQKLVSPESKRAATETKEMAELQAEMLMAKLFQDPDLFPEFASEQIKSDMETPNCFDRFFEAQPAFARFVPEVEEKKPTGFQKHSNWPKWISTSSRDGKESDTVVLELGNGNFADLFEPVQLQFETKLGPSRPLNNKKRSTSVNARNDNMEAANEKGNEHSKTKFVGFSPFDFEEKLESRNDVTDLADKTLLRDQHDMPNVEPHWGRDGGTFKIELQEFVQPQFKETDSVHREKQAHKLDSGDFDYWNLLRGLFAPNPEPLRDTDEGSSTLELEDFTLHEDKQADGNHAGNFADWTFFLGPAMPSREPARNTDGDEGPSKLDLEDFIRDKDEESDRQDAGSLADTTSNLKRAASNAKAVNVVKDTRGRLAASISPNLLSGIIKGVLLFICISLSILYIYQFFVRINGRSWWSFTVRHPAVLEENAKGAGLDNRAFKMCEIV